MSIYSTQRPENSVLTSGCVFRKITIFFLPVRFSCAVTGYFKVGMFVCVSVSEHFFLPLFSVRCFFCCLPSLLLHWMRRVYFFVIGTLLPSVRMERSACRIFFFVLLLFAFSLSLFLFIFSVEENMCSQAASHSFLFICVCVSLHALVTVVWFIQTLQRTYVRQSRQVLRDSDYSDVIVCLSFFFCSFVGQN